MGQGAHEALLLRCACAMCAGVLCVCACGRVPGRACPAAPCTHPAACGWRSTMHAEPHRRVRGHRPLPSGSHGLGPWYLDMEERLRNPYFIGSRAWNGPIEGWVGKNKVRGRRAGGCGGACVAREALWPRACSLPCCGMPQHGGMRTCVHACTRARRRT